MVPGTKIHAETHLRALCTSGLAAPKRAWSHPPVDTKESLHWCLFSVSDERKTHITPLSLPTSTSTILTFCSIFSQIFLFLYICHKKWVFLLPSPFYRRIIDLFIKDKIYIFLKTQTSPCSADHFRVLPTFPHVYPLPDKNGISPIYRSLACYLKCTHLDSSSNVH